MQNLKGAYSGLPEANIVVHICMPVDAIFQFPVCKCMYGTKMDSVSADSINCGVLSFSLKH